MIYHFDSNLAQEYGVSEAIVINNFQYWILKNKANKTNFHNGHWWTYNSHNAFLELFPFWSEQNIKTILNHLREKGVIITGNYNSSPYDKTLWYAFEDENKFLNNTKQCIDYNEPIDKLELTNQEVRTNQPIPDIIPDIIPNKKLIKKINKKNETSKDRPDVNAYGEFNNVYLTKDEIGKLLKKYGWYFKDAIELLSSYLEMHEDKYKNHYAVMCENNWVWNKVHNNPDCGIKSGFMIADPAQPGGLRRETPKEYFERTNYIKL